MIRTAKIIFCDNEHGTGDVTFPDIVTCAVNIVAVMLRRRTPRSELVPLCPAKIAALLTAKVMPLGVDNAVPQVTEHSSIKEDTMQTPESKLDLYAEALIAQNAGGTCKHCESSLGHRSTCPLICRETAEAHSAVDNGVTEADSILLKGLGVIW